MSKQTTYNELLSLVEEMFEDHTSMSEVPIQEFNADEMNYNEIKSLICNKMLQLMLEINQDDEMNERDKFVSITSSMATLAAENFVLWYERLRGN